MLAPIGWWSLVSPTGWRSLLSPALLLLAPVGRPSLLPPSPIGRWNWLAPLRRRALLAPSRRRGWLAPTGRRSLLSPARPSLLTALANPRLNAPFFEHLRYRSANLFGARTLLIQLGCSCFDFLTLLSGEHRHVRPLRIVNTLTVTVSTALVSPCQSSQRQGHRRY